MSSRMLVVGLGNPGPRYQNTPHNLGFEVVDLLASECRMTWSPESCLAGIASGRLGEIDLVLAKPQTYVNRSGSAVAAALERYALSVEDLVVVCDDLALPLGRIRIRGRGSSGGHNGLKSVIESLGRSDFIRVRLGISPAFAIVDAAEYVLSPIVSELRPAVQEMVTQGKEAVKMISSQGLLPAMNRFNR